MRRVAEVSQSSAAPVADTPHPAPARLGYVDGLRALAALYVVASHCVTEVWPYNNIPSGAVGQFAGFMQYGHFAVSVFIVLSGFSLMLPVARRGNRLPQGALGFYWRRARRILPPYYLALALSLLLIWLWIGQPTGTHWDVSLPVTPQAVVEHLFLLQDFAHQTPAAINLAFWSIAMECQIYVLFPALVLLWRRYSPLFTVAVVVSLSFALVLWLNKTWLGGLAGYTTSEFAPQYFGLFAMGMFAASVYTAPTLLWTRLQDWRLWESLTLMCTLVMVAKSATWYMYQIDFFIGPGAVGLLLAASRPGRFNPVRAALEWRPLVWVGGISYSIYLIHAPLIQLLWQYGLHPLGLSDLLTYLALLVIGLPLIVAASWLFWYGCERPFLNTKPGAVTGNGAAWLRLPRLGRASAE